MTFEWGRRSAGTALMAPVSLTRRLSKSQKSGHPLTSAPPFNVPFGVTYEKIGTIQRRLAWPLHKDDTLSRSGRSTDLNIYALFTSESFRMLNKRIEHKFASRYGTTKSRVFLFW